MRWLASLSRGISQRAFSAGVATANTYVAVPRLPIPALSDTCARYLASVKPLLSHEDFLRTKAAVDTFARDGGFGEILQQRLRALDDKEEHSWLENIWLQKAYLEWREPSLINVNWWCQLKDSSTVKQVPEDETITDIQVTRAAGLVSNFLDFKEIIDGKLLPQEFIKENPLCMHQYTNVFGVTRVPGEKADTISGEFPATARHIIVMVRNQMYKVDVISTDGKRVSVDAIAKFLRDADQNSLRGPLEPPVGVLTAGHRDTNYKAYARLLSLGSQNAENLDLIRTSLFFVCLDTHGGSKITPEQTHSQIFHNYDASNRWFDKAIQLIVLPSGRAGVNGEHTPTDAVIPGRVMNHVVKHEPAVGPKDGGVSVNAVDAPKKLVWQVDNQVKDLIKEAQATSAALIQDTYSCLLQTNIYGSNFIKNIAKAGPDAYVQIALQLAWRKLYTEPTAIYESASIRLFKHGRTETIRSLTEDTWAFANAFHDASVSNDEKRILFGKAIKSQSNQARDASVGKGIDRHLLALRTLIASPEEAKKATLFTDPAYIKSMYFKLSSSNMSPGDTFYGGFGPVVPDGYGVNYAIGKEGLKFSVSHKPSCKSTDAVKFRDALLDSLVELKALFEAGSENE